MIYDFEEFVNEGKKVDYVIVNQINDYKECIEFVDKNGYPVEVDETEIQNLWKKLKGNKQKFAETVFAEYPDVFEIRRATGDDDDEDDLGEYIDRKLRRWNVYLNDND